MSEEIGINFNNLKEMILLEEYNNCVHPSINKKLKLFKKHQKWLKSSFTRTNIFFRRVLKVPLLKETFTVRKILLV